MRDNYLPPPLLYPSWPWVTNHMSPQAQNLRVWFPMVHPGGRTIFDMSGFGNHATITGGVYRSYTGSQSTLWTDGTDDFATIASLNLSHTNNISVAFWLFWDAYATDFDLVMECTPNMNSYTTGFYFSPNNPSSVLDVTMKGDVGNSAALYTRLSANNWHHYVINLDKSLSTNEVSLYMDGILYAPSSRPSNNNNTNNFGTDPWYFMSRAGTSLFGKGQLADLRIYDRALSAQEIAAIYAPSTRYDLYYEIGRTRYAFPAATAARSQVIIIGG